MKTELIALIGIAVVGLSLWWQLPSGLTTCSELRTAFLTLVNEAHSYQVSDTTGELYNSFNSCN